MLEKVYDFFASLAGKIAGRPYTRRSPQWPSVRRKHLEREPFCQYCLRTTHLQVHHIIPVHIRPDLELQVDNLLVLCELPGAEGCHLKVGHLGSWKKWNLNVREDAKNNRKKLEKAG